MMWHPAMMRQPHLFQIFIQPSPFLYFLPLFVLFMTPAILLLNSKQLFSHDGAYPSPLTSLLTLFRAILGRASHHIIQIIFKPCISCFALRIVSDSRMSSLQQKETRASQKLSCIIRIIWGVKKDGNCNFSENIFPGFIISLFFSNILLWKSIGKCDFCFCPIQCVDEEWKSISTAKKVTAQVQSPIDFNQLIRYQRILS